MTLLLLRYPYWFLRHGETDWNACYLAQGRTDVPLNATGLAQAERAGRVLAERFAAGERPFARIVASPLTRALVTAEKVRDAVRSIGGIDLPLTTDDALKEVCFGAREGERMGDWYTDWVAGRYVPDEGEHFDELRERAVGGVNRILQAEGGVPLIVAHGALFRALRAGMGLEINVRLSNAIPVFARPEDDGRWTATELTLQE